MMIEHGLAKLISHVIGVRDRRSRPTGLKHQASIEQFSFVGTCGRQRDEAVISLKSRTCSAFDFRKPVFVGGILGIEIIAGVSRLDRRPFDLPVRSNVEGADLAFAGRTEPSQIAPRHKVIVLFLRRIRHDTCALL